MEEWGRATMPISDVFKERMGIHCSCIVSEGVSQ